MNADWQDVSFEIKSEETMRERWRGRERDGEAERDGERERESANSIACGSNDTIW